MTVRGKCFKNLCALAILAGMVGRRRTATDNKAMDTKPPDLARRPGQADLNEIVAYNFRRARELRGWTQENAARALAGLLGQRLPQASISAIERAYEGDRHREFDAHEILAFALAFDLPLVWFFLPPPRDHRSLHHTTNIVSELYGIVFGQEDKLQPVYDRLRQLGIDDPGDTERVIENLTGRPSPARQHSYRERRKKLLLALLDQYSDDVDRAAEEIGTFFDHLRQVGVRGLIAEQLNDGEYIGLGALDGLPEPKKSDKRRG
jgi:transcriptional regulator with XRE-family HTH domain